MKKERSLVINAILNVIRQFCVIAFPLVSFPYVSRILGPISYGKFAFSQSIISYITLIAGLGISSYAVRDGSQKSKDKQIFNVFVNEVYTVNIISTLISYTILAILLVGWEKVFDYRTLIIIGSLAVAFTSIGADWVNTVYEDYVFITIRYIVCQVCAVIAMFMFIKNENDYYIYTLINVSPTVIANILNMIHIRYNYGLKIRLASVRKSLRHLPTILIMFSNNIASYIYANSDITILGVLTDDKTVACYSVAVKIYTLTKQLINAFLLVALPRFTKEVAYGNNGRVNEQLNTMFSFLLIIIGPAMAGLFCLSETVIMLIAGSSYIQAVNMLKILSISLIFATIACFYINLIMLPNMLEKKILLAMSISACINILLNIVFIPKFGADIAAVTTVISEMVLVLFGMMSTEKFIQLKVVKPIAVSATGAVEVVIICQLVNKFVNNCILRMILAVFCSMAILLITVLIAYKNDILMGKRGSKKR